MTQPMTIHHLTGTERAARYRREARAFDHARTARRTTLGDEPRTDRPVRLRAARALRALAARLEPLPEPPRRTT